MDILEGLSFHRSLIARIMSTASRAAFCLKRALNHVSLGRSITPFKSSDLEGTELFQKCLMKILQTRPYSVRIFLSSCLLWAVENFREHLEDLKNFIKRTETELEDSYRNNILLGILFLILG